MVSSFSGSRRRTRLSQPAEFLQYLVQVTGIDRRRVAIAIGVLCVLALSRWWTAPKYLYYFDNINFALALERFDPSAHQPQPPGYPLFVLLGLVLHFVFPVREAFLAAGLLAAAAALWLLWLLARRMLDERAAAFSVLTLLFLPAMWLGGITHQVRVFLPAGALAVAYCCWRALSSRSGPNWFLGAAAAVGLAAGFRPDLPVYLAPLLVWTGWRKRFSRNVWLGAAIVLLSAVALWLPYTVTASGGLARYLELIRNYSQDEFSASSAMFGAPVGPALRMAWVAFIWTGLGVLAWVWAVPFALKSGAYQGKREAWLFLLLLFVPAYLFLSLVHVGDPDQTLIVAPAIALLSGWTLSAFAATRRRAQIAVVGVLLLSFAVFFRPPRGIASASGYPAVRKVDEQTQAAFHAIRALSAKERNTVLVSFQSMITYRHLSYYFRDLPLLVLREDPREDPEAERVWLIRRLAVEQPDQPAGRILVEAPARLVWFLPPDPSWRRLLDPPSVFRQHPPVLYSDLNPGEELCFGNYRFVGRARASTRFSFDHDF